MAEACDDCLAAQLGFLPESSYPLSPSAETPERVYCIDGVPSFTPHKGFAGPLIATLTVTPPTLAQTGTLTGEQVDIDFVNETARTINFAYFVAGSIFFQNADDATDWTFTYGFDIVKSSPLLVGPSTNAAWTNTEDLQTIHLGFFGSTTLDPGGTMHVSPLMTYSATVAPGQTVLHGANLQVMFFGGPS